MFKTMEWFYLTREIGSRILRTMYKILVQEKLSYWPFSAAQEICAPEMLGRDNIQPPSRRGLRWLYCLRKQRVSPREHSEAAVNPLSTQKYPDTLITYFIQLQKKSRKCLVVNNKQQMPSSVALLQNPRSKTWFSDTPSVRPYWRMRIQIVLLFWAYLLTSVPNRLLLTKGVYFN